MNQVTVDVKTLKKVVEEAVQIALKGLPELGGRPMSERTISNRALMRELLERDASDAEILAAFTAKYRDEGRKVTPEWVAGRIVTYRREAGSPVGRASATNASEEAHEVASAPRPRSNAQLVGDLVAEGKSEAQIRRAFLRRYQGREDVGEARLKLYLREARKNAPARPARVASGRRKRVA